MKEHFLIGLTGGIGSGKSTAAAELAALGAEVISGDELGKQVLENSRELLSQVRKRFGAEVFASDGTLIRRALAEMVFANEEHARWLTRLTFPGIHNLWLEAVSRSPKEVVVFDAALIFEWQIEKEFDLLLVVQADERQVLARLQRAGRFSERETARRLAIQLPPEAKARQGDVVLQNDGSLQELKEKIRQFWNTRVEPELHQRRKRRNGSS